MKVCRTCKVEKPRSEYYAAKTTKDGLHGSCKACFLAKQKAYKDRVKTEGKVAVAEKACPACGQTKPIAEFHRDRSTRDGHAWACKLCIRAKVDKRYVELVQRGEIVVPEHATCARCGEVKPSEAFNRHRGRATGLDGTCKACRRDAELDYGLRQYGITGGDYRAMLEAQNGGCYTCKAPGTEKRRLSVDHCHATGRVRRLLCGPCNTIVGLAKEDRSIIQAIDAYLAEQNG